MLNLKLTPENRKALRDDKKRVPATTVEGTPVEIDWTQIHPDAWLQLLGGSGFTVLAEVVGNGMDEVRVTL
jgi:hypothetical protein